MVATQLCWTLPLLENRLKNHWVSILTTETNLCPNRGNDMHTYKPGDTCECNGCENEITVPSLDCPGQCLSCAQEARERVEAGLRAAEAGRAPDRVYDSN